MRNNFVSSILGTFRLLHGFPNSRQRVGQRLRRPAKSNGKFSRKSAHSDAETSGISSGKREVSKAKVKSNPGGRLIDRLVRGSTRASNRRRDGAISSQHVSFRSRATRLSRCIFMKALARLKGELTNESGGQQHEGTARTKVWQKARREWCASGLPFVTNGDENSKTSEGMKRRGNARKLVEH